MNVFAPTKATTKSRLPVYVFIQGGGFNNNGNANMNGSDLVRGSGEGIVVVNFNYRVGPYGFLASKEILANKTLSLNNGLKDQRQLLKWVQKHIDQVRRFLSFLGPCYLCNATSTLVSSLIKIHSLEAILSTSH